MAAACWGIAEALSLRDSSDQLLYAPCQAAPYCQVAAAARSYCYSTGLLARCTSQQNLRLVGTDLWRTSAGNV